MVIDNPQVTNEIKSIDGDVLQPEQIAPADIASKTTDTDVLAWKRESDSKYSIPNCMLELGDKILQPELKTPATVNALTKDTDILTFKNLDDSNYCIPNCLLELAGVTIQPEIVAPADISGKSLDTDAVLFKNLSDNKYLGSPAIITVGGSVLLTTILTIGNWNMDSAEYTNVAHSITDWKNIRIVSVIIRNDADTAYYKLERVAYGTSTIDGGVDSITSTNIVIGRSTGGFFDSGNFSNSPYNRGWITVIYEG